jgi:hypothetical protein
VWAELLDPQSRNRKCRPAVIFTPTDEIYEGRVKLLESGDNEAATKG